ncbi:MAG: HNH endonuclease [Aestuariivita sp.]|nr:HNH endonuclease [Aestuariivita sp.]
MLRDAIPQRRNVPSRPHYTDYRDDLRTDFNGRCGYCDDSDFHCDPICFHIDHFAPKSRFKALETEYGNLVYACRFCNVRKSSHWVGLDPATPNDGKRGFVDPCDPCYDAHLSRSTEGAIISRSALGQYMFKRLGLHLVRHQVLWHSRRARKLRDEIDLLIVRYKQSNLPNSAIYTALLERYRDLTIAIDRYEGQAHE